MQQSGNKNKFTHASCSSFDLYVDSENKELTKDQIDTIEQNKLKARRKRKAFLQKLQPTLYQNFVPASLDDKPSKNTFNKKQRSQRPSLIEKATDWKILCDIDADTYTKRDYIFPSQICDTEQKPDMVIFSEECRICVIIELTSPFDDNIACQHERKDKKYYNLVAAASKNDWSLHQHSIEVAALGTCGINLKESVLQRTLGLSKSKSRKVETRCSEIAKHCSHIIWNNRFNRLFNEPLWRNPDGLKGLGLAFPTQKKKTPAPIP